MVLFIGVANSSVGQTWQSIITSSCTGQNYGKSIAIHNGKQYFAGTFEGNLNIGFNSIFGLANDDIFIGKASLEGNTEWLRSLRGPLIDQASNIEVINDTVMVSGIFTDTLFIESDTLINNFQRGTFIAYFDTLGNYIKSFVPDVWSAEIKDFALDNDGNIVMLGDFFQQFNYAGVNMSSITGLNFFLCKYDPVADSIMWAVNASGATSEGMQLDIGPNNEIYTIGLFDDGTVLIDTLLITGNANHNFFVSKFDALGNKLWVRTIVGSDEVHGFSIATDDSGNFFVTGEFEGTVSLQGAGTHLSNGFYDILLAKYDANGNVLWSEGFGGTESDEGYDLVLDENQDPILLADFSGAGAQYQNQTIPVNGWKEPLLMKVMSANGQLIWYRTIFATTGSGIVNGNSLAREGNAIAVTGTNRSSILFNSNSFVAQNQKDFYTMVLYDSLTYHLGVYEQTPTFEIGLYPNPCRDVLYIHSNESELFGSIFAADKQLIREIYVKDSEGQVDMGGLPAGVYFINFVSENNTTTIRIIKQ